MRGRDGLLAGVGWWASVSIGEGGWTAVEEGYGSVGGRWGVSAEGGSLDLGKSVSLMAWRWTEDWCFYSGLSTPPLLRSWYFSLGLSYRAASTFSTDYDHSSPSRWKISTRLLVTLSVEVSDSVSDPSSSLLSSGNGSNWWALAGLRGGKGFQSVLRSPLDGCGVWSYWFWWKKVWTSRYANQDSWIWILCGDGPSEPRVCLLALRLQGWRCSRASAAILLAAGCGGRRWIYGWRLLRTSGYQQQLSKPGQHIHRGSRWSSAIACRSEVSCSWWFSHSERRV